MKEERKRILKMVEKGELSAEEAITLIEKLEEEYKNKEAEMLNELSVEVLSTNDGQHESKQKTSKASSFAAKFMDFVDAALKKVKDLEFDFNFGQSVQFSHIFQLQKPNAVELSIHLLNGSVTVEPWNEEDIRVECEIKAFKTEEVTTAREMFLQYTQCQMEGNRFVFFTDKRTMKVNAIFYVPARIYQQVKIKLFNGPIRGERLKIENLKAKTANGMISFKQVEGKKVVMQTANGQIKLNQFSYDDVDLETINGLVDVNGQARKLDLQSFNGHLIVKMNEPSCHTIYAKTTTGNIDFDFPEHMAIDGEWKSNLGSFSYDPSQLTIIDEKNEVLQKKLRFTTNPLSENRLTLFAETKTGSIFLKP